MTNYNDLKRHVGHEVEVVKYGEKNVAVECITCSEVITDEDRGDRNQ